MRRNEISAMVGLLVMVVFCLAGCGEGGGSDNTFAVLAANAAAQQQKIDATNKSIIESSVLTPPISPEIPVSPISPHENFPTGGKVAGTSMVKSIFGNSSTASGKIQGQVFNRYSVDIGGRITKRKAVFGTSSSATTYNYDGATTVLKGMSVVNSPSPDVILFAYTYDSSGRITEYTTTYYGISTTAIVYDATGRTQTTDSGGDIFTYAFDTHNYPIYSSNGTSSLKCVPTYDASGNRIAERYYYKTATATEILVHESISTYGPNGVIDSTNKVYDQAFGHLMYTILTTNIYGTNGKKVLASVVTYDPSGAIVGTMSATFSYDSSGNQLSQDMVQKDAAGTVILFYNDSMTYITLVSGKDDQ